MAVPLIKLEYTALLKDGREIQLRFGQLGEEAAIARVVAPGFSVYRCAARGNLQRAAELLAQELNAGQFVVAVLTGTHEIIGVTRLTKVNPRPRHTRLALAQQKVKLWGALSLFCFVRARLIAIWLETHPHPLPDELAGTLSAVDARYRSLGVYSQIIGFIERYAAAAGYRAVWFLHRTDNLAALAVQRKRGSQITPLPPTLLARLLRYPITCTCIKVVNDTTYLAGPGSASLIE